jgi:hypothetical protein
MFELGNCQQISYAIAGQEFILMIDRYFEADKIVMETAGILRLLRILFLTIGLNKLEKLKLDEAVKSYQCKDPYKM